MMLRLALGSVLLLSFFLPGLVHAQADSGTTHQKSFDVEAGPIWDNEHAKIRCPEVLKDWLLSHPGQNAEWTGHWTTTVQNEMSVCNLRIIR
ncbi:MAG: mannan-binding lectin [Desulfovibrio sp.]|nr:mannan-binding lectin [Desulfovibrio sp.]